MKILIVDDSSTARKMLEVTLLKLDIENLCLIEAENGVEALQKYNEHKPEFTICDINMPQMNGLEFLKELNKVNPDVKIGFVTSLSKTQMSEYLIDEGALFVLSKPLNVAIIREEIQKIQSTL